jgi:hypothetical protein
MPKTSGPFTPVAGTSFNVQNPAASGGSLVTAEAVIVNLSPYELQIAAADGSPIALIDPFTRDGVPLDPTSQQLTITPLNVGFNPPAGVSPTIYVLWYGALEQIPTSLPMQIVDAATAATSGGIGIAAPTVALQTGGQDVSGNMHPSRVDGIGEQFVVSAPPGSGGFNHPPNELKYASTASLGSGNLIAAPGAGNRIRVFYAWAANNGNGICLLDATLGGITIQLVGTVYPNFGSCDFKPSGLALDANTAVTIITSSGQTINGGVVYTVESV